MSDYDHDQDLYGDDERFYEETVYNEEYYIEQERGLIRQSNLDLELEELEERHIREICEEGLPRPVLIKPGESDSEAVKESPLEVEFGVIAFSRNAVSPLAHDLALPDGPRAPNDDGDFRYGSPSVRLSGLSARDQELASSSVPPVSRSTFAAPHTFTRETHSRM